MKHLNCVFVFVLFIMTYLIGCGQQQVKTNHCTLWAADVLDETSGKACADEDRKLEETIECFAVANSYGGRIHTAARYEKGQSVKRMYSDWDLKVSTLRQRAIREVVWAHCVHLEEERGKNGH